MSSKFAFLKEALAKQVKIEELLPDDVIIALVTSCCQLSFIYQFRMFPALWAQLDLARAPYIFRYIHCRFH
jgi:hypothetical protein